MPVRKQRRAGVWARTFRARFPKFKESLMRRVVGTILVFLLWLGPFAAILPANAEARLPACCRRHGAHHCEMAGTAGLGKSSPGPVFGAPRHCPSYPTNLTRSTAPTGVLATDSVRVFAQVARPAVPSNSRLVIHSTLLKTRANRGPPSPAKG